MNKVSRVKNTNFTVISNVFLRDKNLSIKAKGFLAVVMGLSEDWEFSIKGICAILKEGKSAIYGVIDELKEKGYCVVTKERNESGLFSGNDYTFYEEPHTEEPHTENRDTDNQSQLNTNINNNEGNKVKNKLSPNPPIDFSAIMNVWNETVEKVEGISKIDRMSDKRKQAIKALLNSCSSNVEELLLVIRTLPYADHWVTSKKSDKEWCFSFDWFIKNTNNWYVKALEGQMHKKNAEIFKRIMAGEVPVSAPTESKDTICINGQIYR